MLVKELRQGLRTNLFVTAFILLQGLMILCILMGSSEPDSNEAANGFFWFFISVTFLVVQPIRGFSALSSEYILNTMDLIQLTRLNAMRIAWGKWLAINAQTFLLLTAVIPYVVLRYFFGLVNVFADLGMLALLALSSGLLSAVAVGCSAFKNLIVRVALIIGAVVGYSITFSFTRFEILRSGISSANFLNLSVLILGSIFGIWFFLSVGASRIASASENHAFKKRITGLIFSVGVCSLQLFGADEELCITVSSIILALTAIDAITEPPPVFATVLRPFSKSILLKPLAYLLTPGWHTGILFLIFPCLLVSTAVLFLYNGVSPDFEEVTMLIAGAGTITFPLIIIHLFFKKATFSHSLFAIYLFCQAALALVTILTVAVAESANIEEIVYLFMPIPSNIFFGALDGGIDSLLFLSIAIFWLAVSLLIPLIRGSYLFRQMGKTFREFKKPKPDPDTPSAAEPTATT